MEKLLNLIGEIAAVNFGTTIEEIRGKSRKQNIADARTVYSRSIYKNSLMDGPALGKHLGCSAEAIYYHVRKYEDMKFGGGHVSRMLDEIEAKIGKEVASWREKRSI